MKIDQGNVIVIAAVIASGVLVAVSVLIKPFVNVWLEKKRFELDMRIAEIKLFSEMQRKRAVALLNDVRAFYKLEKFYTAEIARLRAGGGIVREYDDLNVLREFRNKLGVPILYTEEYDYNSLLNFFSKTRPATSEVFKNIKQNVEKNIDGTTVGGASATGNSDDMVLIEGGTFEMGSDNSIYDDEKPVHRVTVESFRICKYLVTLNDWVRVMGYNPSDFSIEPATGEEQILRPVESVSWYDAIRYCNKRSEVKGLTPCYTIDGEDVKCDWSANGYRLPTEAEWEYAARSGSMEAARQFDYSGSYGINEIAWYDENSSGKHIR